MFSNNFSISVEDVLFLIWGKTTDLVTFCNYICRNLIIATENPTSWLEQGLQFSMLSNVVKLRREMVLQLV
jgi:hypothetical protein